MSQYDQFPTIAAIDGSACWRGWQSIRAEIRRAIAAFHPRASAADASLSPSPGTPGEGRGGGSLAFSVQRSAFSVNSSPHPNPLPEYGARGRNDQARIIIAVECYTGLLDEVQRELGQGLPTEHFFSTRHAFKSPAEIDRLVAPWLGGDDPLFGRLTTLEMIDFFDAEKLAKFRQEISSRHDLIVVFGPGALLCCEPDIIIYADMPRWEGQLRQRRNEVSNLGVENKSLKASLKYKRSFFIDWRVCDHLKAATMDQWDYLLDSAVASDPKLITGSALRSTLDRAARQPFRVVPFFDPAPWGGQWLKKHFQLDPKQENYGWGFDCVPEENSLVLDFNGVNVEIPAMDLVLYRPRELLGEKVFNRFGAEFPIRFDFLDTIGGGNLSFQVHPLAEFARHEFGITYTQDESYYILQAERSGSVFLGLKKGVNPNQMIDELKDADRGGRPFDATKFVNEWPARKHDHFLIPAGTVHCSGAGTLVLEISATPYIFTFKLWDWGRLGLDGLPRPTNIERGEKVIQWERDCDWTQSQLISQTKPLDSGNGWRSERTGLHAFEFIETHRHWFTNIVPHQTHGSVNVLNLVEGESAIVESPTGAFPPFTVHYAETFIVPAAVKEYTIRPMTAASKELATIKAMVREA